MSGLLRRLAANVTGSAAVLRSDVRLPYAADSGLDWAEAEPAGVGSACIEASRSEPAEPDHFCSAAPGRPTAAPVDAIGQPMSAVRQRTGAEPPVPHAPSLPLRATVEADRVPRPERGDPPRLIASSDALASMTEQGAIATAPVPGAATVGQPASSPFAGNIPAPLLPRAAPADTTPRSSASRVPAVAPQMSVRPTADDGAEVHIHIGRIEVTAVQDPAPAAPRRRAPAPPRAPMSLDSYLAARSRRSGP